MQKQATHATHTTNTTILPTDMAIVAVTPRDKNFVRILFSEKREKKIYH
jgi:hypothetical protein